MKAHFISRKRNESYDSLVCVCCRVFATTVYEMHPRKRITETLKEGAYSGTSFNCSDNGWLTEKLYIDWFDFFLKTTPPT